MQTAQTVWLGCFALLKNRKGCVLRYEKKEFPFVYVLLIVIAVLCLCGFIFREPVNRKSYVRFDGKYYYSVGATVDPSVVGEQVGKVERRAPRMIFNRKGDSNFFEEGAKIYKPIPEVAAESGDIIYVEFTQILIHPDQTEERLIKYSLLRAE